MSITTEITKGEKNIIIFGTVKGLASEREKLKKVFNDFSPQLMLLGISPEEFEGLKKYLKEPFEIEPDDYGLIYAKKLEKFGEVGLPVPTYLEAFAISKRTGVEMLPIDMPDEVYSELFIRKLDFFKIMRFNMRKRKVWKKEFPSSSPEDFVIAWDREVNKIREFREIEEEREKYMSTKIHETLKEREERKILVIVELERMKGVVKGIEKI